MKINVKKGEGRKNMEATNGQEGVEVKEYRKIKEKSRKLNARDRRKGDRIWKKKGGYYLKAWTPGVGTA